MSWCDSASGFLQVFSPAIVVGAAAWKVGHTWRLRTRQRDALKNLCNQILKLTDFHRHAEITERINRLIATRDFFDRTVIGEKAPIGLIDEIIEINALIASIRETWDRFLTHTQANQDRDPFVEFRKKAGEIEGRARLVLYSL